MTLVIDASVTLAWAFPDEVVGGIDDVFRRSAETSFLVPAHWKAEVANALLMSERKKRVSVEQVARLTKVVETLEFAVDHEGMRDVLLRALPLARAHDLTVYDALYLELAERTGSSLASLDGDLVKAAQKVGVKTLP